MSNHDYGPPPLSDEELAQIESLFRYSRPETIRCVDLLRDPTATEEQRRQALAELERIRGER